MSGEKRENKNREYENRENKTEKIKARNEKWENKTEKQKVRNENRENKYENYHNWEYFSERRLQILLVPQLIVFLKLWDGRSI